MQNYVNIYVINLNQQEKEKCVGNLVFSGMTYKKNMQLFKSCVLFKWKNSVNVYLNIKLRIN